jgi:hypothetical protein
LNLFANRAHAPGAIPCARNLGGVDLQLVAVDGDGALPGAPLGQTRVVSEQDALGRVSLPAGFLDADSGGAKIQVARDAVFVGFDNVADGAHRVDHVDTDRPDGGGSIGGHRTEANIECSTPSRTMLKGRRSRRAPGSAPLPRRGRTLRRGDVR